MGFSKFWIENTTGKTCPKNSVPKKGVLKTAALKVLPDPQETEVS